MRWFVLISWVHYQLFLDCQTAAGLSGRSEPLMWSNKGWKLSTKELTQTVSKQNPKAYGVLSL